jgi:hypothetical protein
VVTIAETADTVPPTFESGLINYTNGEIELRFSETVSSIGNNIDLSKMFLSDYRPVIYELAGIQFQRYVDGSDNAISANQPSAQPGFNAYVLGWNAIQDGSYDGYKIFSI